MIRTFATLLLASSAMVPFAVQAQELPTSGTVVAGQASIGTAAPGVMTITQGSDRAIINWNSFSIGEGGRVDIQQLGADSVLLNRVTGDAQSRIAGAMNANGQVFLVNPNGILITSTGSINAGGFVASTLDIADDRFMLGDIAMTGGGGAVRNQGRISIVRGGYAALIGGSVDNAGLIAAPLGRVGLGAGTRATLDLNGDGFLQVAMPAANGGVAMSGRISADGGSVLLTAASAVHAARHTVNLSGVIEARGVEGRSGSVVLTGPDIALTGATIDVSGAAGGGSVKIGGDYMGGGVLQHANTLSVDAASTIRADAVQSGDGGDIVLWSDKTTRFAGTLSARGAGGGSGGDAEVSSKGVLGYTGFADLRGATFGTLLLDPYNITISNGADANSAGLAPSGNDSVINTATLQNALGAANVTISTGGAGSPGAQAGDITVASALTWAAPTTLTLNAHRAIAINAPISITGAGGLALNYDASALTNLRFGANGAVDYGATDNGGSLSINAQAYTLIYSMAQLDAIDGVENVGGAAVTQFGAGLAGRYALATRLNAAGTTYTKGLIAGGGPSGLPPAFSGTLEGLGNTISGLTIAGGANTYVGLIGRSTGTVRDIGMVGAAVSGTHDVGALVGLNESSGLIAQAYASGIVSGGDDAFSLGGLVGASLGTITHSYANVGVSGGERAKDQGGLVGYSTGPITQSYATGAVSGGTGAKNLGGLVGYSTGPITQSHATGAVGGGAGANILGGLVGYSSGTITQSHATGAVSGEAGANILGGLVGLLTGAVTQSYATGAVSGGDDAKVLGGLVGGSSGTITQSYATGTVSGGARARILGGLVGQSQLTSTIHQSYAAGAVIGGNNARLLGGLVGVIVNGTAISQSYAAGAVSGGTGALELGGLVGRNQGGTGTITDSYWNKDTTGQAVSAGSLDTAGLTTAQLQSGVLPAGFDSTVWGSGSGLYSYLKVFFPTGVQAVSGFAYKADGTAMASGANGAVSVSIANGGAVVGSATTGANGYYYMLVAAGTLADDAGVAAFTQDNAASGAQNAVAYQAGAPLAGLNSGLDLTGGWRRDSAGPLDTLSALNAGYMTTIGGAAPSSFALGKRQIATGGAFSLDQALTVTDTLWLSGSGTVTQSAGLTAPTLLLTGDGGYWLTNAGNAIDRLAARADGVKVASSLALTIAANQRDAAGGAVSGVAASAPGGIEIATLGDLTIALGATVSGANPVLAARGAFHNLQGGNAVTATSGRWLIYAAAPTGNTFGNLDSGNAAIWNTVAGNFVLETGNRYVFAYRPTLTLTTTDGTKTYGDDATAQVAGLYAITGFDPGVAGAYRADTAASALTGTASVTSTGAAATANVAGGPYAITATAGTLTALSGYALNFVNTGKLTVGQRALTIAADALSRIYGDANPALTYRVGGLGLVNGDTLSGNLTTAATGVSSVGVYGITQGTLGNANYAVTYQGANLTIVQRALTITADALSRIYGDANPTLTYQVSGLINGDTLSGALSTTATAASNVGVYGITQGTLGNANYAVAYQGANLTIGQRALTVTADMSSRFYGSVNPSLTYTIGGLGLVNGDTLSGELATSATATSAAGSYVVTQGTLFASSNYALSFLPGELVVRALTVPSEYLSGSLQRDALISRIASQPEFSTFELHVDDQGVITAAEAALPAQVLALGIRQ